MKAVPWIFAGLIAIGGGSAVVDHFDHHGVTSAAGAPAIHASVIPQAAGMPNPSQMSRAALQQQVRALHILHVHPHINGRQHRIYRIIHPFRAVRFYLW